MAVAEQNDLKEELLNGDTGHAIGDTTEHVAASAAVEISPISTPQIKLTAEETPIKLGEVHATTVSSNQPPDAPTAPKTADEKSESTDNTPVIRKTKLRFFIMKYWSHNSSSCSDISFLSFDEAIELVTSWLLYIFLLSRRFRWLVDWSVDWAIDWRSFCPCHEFLFLHTVAASGLVQPATTTATTLSPVIPASAITLAKASAPAPPGAVIKRGKAKSAATPPTTVVLSRPVTAAATSTIPSTIAPANIRFITMSTSGTVSPAAAAALAPQIISTVSATPPTPSNPGTVTISPLATVVGGAATTKKPSPTIVTPTAATIPVTTPNAVRLIASKDCWQWSSYNSNFRLIDWLIDWTTEFVVLHVAKAGRSRHRQTRCPGEIGHLHGRSRTNDSQSRRSHLCEEAHAG